MLQDIISKAGLRLRSWASFNILEIQDSELWLQLVQVASLYGCTWLFSIHIYSLLVINRARESV